MNEMRDTLVEAGESRRLLPQKRKTFPGVCESLEMRAVGNTEFVILRGREVWSHHSFNSDVRVVPLIWGFLEIADTWIMN